MHESHHINRKEGETVKSRVSALLAMAHDFNYTIPDGWIFQDEGISGSLLQRPA
jgi:hypothetical protein